MFLTDRFAIMTSHAAMRVKQNRTVTGDFKVDIGLVQVIFAAYTPMLRATTYFLLPRDYRRFSFS
jgi:hypothetical protein